MWSVGEGWVESGKLSQETHCVLLDCVRCCVGERPERAGGREGVKEAGRRGHHRNF